MDNELRTPIRELHITPAARTFLSQSGATAQGRELLYEIGRALRSEGPRKRKNQTRACPPFCLRVVDSATPGGPERVIVWSGRTEGGIFYDDSILKRTELCTEPLDLGIN